MVVIEGNHLLLARPGWESLADLVHRRVMLDVPLATLCERLIQRWLDQGQDPEQTRIRAMSNDIPNVKVVIQ